MSRVGRGGLELVRRKAIPQSITTILVAFGLTVCGSLAMVSGVADASCSNESIRLQEGLAQSLPDCRAYEQVTPVWKNLADAHGGANEIQTSPNGSLATFFSTVPFPGIPGSASFPIYLSQREGTVGGALWATDGLVPPSAPGTAADVTGTTNDLSKIVVLSYEELAPGGVPGKANYYVRDSKTGRYQLFATEAAGESPQGLKVAAATPGGARIIFEDSAKLLPGAREGVYNLYEWTESGTSLVGVLPESGEAPVGGTSAGAGECEPEGCAGSGGALGEFYTEDVISTDGSKVFFTDDGTGRVYMRDTTANVTIPVSEGAADWRTATPDGLKAFYIEEGELYSFAAGSSPGSEGTREKLTVPAAEVIGTSGISHDGSYIYFVARNVLAGRSMDGRLPSRSSANLYEWHAGVTTFIADLSLSSDVADWRDRCPCNHSAPAEGTKSSLVSDDGHTLLFATTEKLTAYNNDHKFELYVYSADNQRVTCVSCNTQTIGAVSSTYLAGEPSQAKAHEPSLVITRNLTADGQQGFFETEEALVPQDTNGQMDVYEWEQEGSGACHVGGGICIYLLSTGVSSNGSYFGNASADGKDVFFITRQSLVNQDQDANQDLYDARIGGGIPAQNVPPIATCEGESCLTVRSPEPVFGAPSSATFSDIGNVTTTLGENSTGLKGGGGAKPKTTKRAKKKRHKTMAPRAHKKHARRKKK